MTDDIGAYKLSALQVVGQTLLSLPNVYCNSEIQYPRIRMNQIDR